MSNASVPECNCKPVVADLLAALIVCRPIIEDHGTEGGYGYYRPANPHDFHPDGDSCSEEEIAAHKAACEAFDKGEYVPEGGHQCAPGAHILVAPWGIGGYTYTDPECAKLLAEIDAAIAKARP